MMNVISKYLLIGAAVTSFGIHQEGHAMEHHSFKAELTKVLANRQRPLHQQPQRREMNSVPSSTPSHAPTMEEQELQKAIEESKRTYELEQLREKFEREEVKNSGSPIDIFLSNPNVQSAEKALAWVEQKKQKYKRFCKRSEIGYPVGQNMRYSFVLITLDCISASLEKGDLNGIKKLTATYQNHKKALQETIEIKTPLTWEDYTNRRLVVGCQHTVKSEDGSDHTHKGDYTINLDPSEQADAVCDFSRKRQLEFIPDNFFQEVYLEWVTSDTLSIPRTFKNAFRILAPGGKLVFDNYSRCIIANELGDQVIIEPFSLILSVRKAMDESMRESYYQQARELLKKQLEDIGFVNFTYTVGLNPYNGRQRSTLITVTKPL